MLKCKEEREKKKEMLFIISELIQKLDDEKLKILLAFMEGVQFFKSSGEEKRNGVCE